LGYHNIRTIIKAKNYHKGIYQQEEEVQINPDLSGFPEYCANQTKGKEYENENK